MQTGPIHCKCQSRSRNAARGYSALVQGKVMKQFILIVALVDRCICDGQLVGIEGASHDSRRRP
jgi:hypothetical protein